MKTEAYALCALVKLYRKKLNLSQSELVKDICVPSYLSKIENAEVEPNIQIIKLLLEKMGIQFYSEKLFSEDENKLLADYFDYIFFFRHQETEALFERIKKKKKKYINSVKFVNYLLIEWHRLIFSQTRINRQYEIRRLLASVKHLMSPENRSVYYFLCAFMEGSDDIAGNLRTATENHNNGYYSYQLASVLISRGIYLDSIRYLDMAEFFFMEEGNFRGLVFTKNLRAVVYYLLKDYQKVEKHAEGVIRLLESSNTEDDFIMGFKYFALQNIAIVAKKQEQYEAMQKACDTIILEQETKYHKVYTTGPYLILSDYYYLKGDEEKAREYLKEATKRHDRILTTDRIYEIELCHLYEFRLENSDYIKTKSYEKQLLKLKKITDKKECLHFKETIRDKLKEFYIANKRYKDAYFIAEKNP
jgi:transcriptional regulator with XRE-family HTH domain